MGKRSNFERRPADFYPTPRAAVVPLIPHLRGIRTFAEPCAGQGDLVRHLESFGLRCVYQGDISTGQDALACDKYGNADANITNPPYTRDVMHRLIEHFQHIAPTWLLLEFNWAATKQAAPFMHHCSDIVIVPRLKWIEGSRDTAKDDHAWYRFDSRHSCGPVFHNNRGRSEVIPSRRIRICEQCRKPYQPQRSSSRFCSPACRQRAHHRRLSVTLSVTPEPGTAGTEVFRYVRHADVSRFKAEGWQATPALDGTHHGEYSVLMRRTAKADAMEFLQGALAGDPVPAGRIDAHPPSLEGRPKTKDGQEIIGLADNPCDYCGQGVGPPGPQSGPVYLVCNPFNGRSEPLHEDCAGFWFEWLGKVAKDVRDRVLSHRCPT